MTKKKDQEKTENKEPVSSLSSKPVEEKKKEEKKAPEVPPVSNVLRESEREKSKLTEILLILIIILLGATSIYFYQANERLTEKYHSLSKGLEDNSGALAVIERDVTTLKSEKDNSKETLEQIKQDISGLLQINETIKERIYNLSEGQRENIREISRIVTKITVSEKDEAISELKKALLIVNGINKKGSTSNARVIGEKLETDINKLIKEIANDGKAPVERKEEVKRTGFGKIELKEAPPAEDEKPASPSETEKQDVPDDGKPSDLEKQ